MSRIQEMIEQLCPEGVDFKTFGEVCKYQQPTPYIVKKVDYSDEYSTPVLTAGQTFILGYTNEKDGIYPASKEHPVIIFDDFTGAFKWVDFPFKVKSSAMKILTVNGTVLLRYVFHYMGTVNYTSTEHTRLWIGTYSSFEIPVPPLEVQREIVKVLDSFSEHTVALVAELDAELAARKKQYEYYKETLLADAEDYEYAPLDSICNKIDNIKWKAFEGTREYIDLSSVDRQNHLILQTTTIDKETAPSRAQQIIHTNDILFGTTRPTLMRFCLIDGRFDNQICSTGYCVLRPKENVCPRWLYYQISSKRFYDYVEDNQSGAGYPSISDTLVKSFSIPLPPISEQERIITTLEKYEELASILCSNLSAEIKARQQKYEFYRDQLLTFKRAN